MRWSRCLSSRSLRRCHRSRSPSTRSPPRAVVRSLVLFPMRESRGLCSAGGHGRPGEFRPQPAHCAAPACDSDDGPLLQSESHRTGRAGTPRACCTDRAHRQERAARIAPPVVPGSDPPKTCGFAAQWVLSNHTHRWGRSRQDCSFQEGCRRRSFCVRGRRQPAAWTIGWRTLGADRSRPGSNGTEPDTETRAAAEPVLVQPDGEPASRRGPPRPTHPRIAGRLRVSVAGCTLYMGNIHRNTVGQPSRRSCANREVAGRSWTDGAETATTP